MKVINYIKESYNELVHKVSWPSPSELVNSAIVVLVASIFIAIIVWIMDKSFETIMENIYNLLAK